VHWVRKAFSFAFASAGNSIAAKIAIMAITTSNSIKVNARALKKGRDPSLTPRGFSL
jgi:hypothetical protein